MQLGSLTPPSPQPPLHNSASGSSSIPHHHTGPRPASASAPGPLLLQPLPWRPGLARAAARRRALLARSWRWEVSRAWGWGFAAAQLLSPSRLPVLGGGKEGGSGGAGPRTSFAAVGSGSAEAAAREPGGTCGGGGGAGSGSSGSRGARSRNRFGAGEGGRRVRAGKRPAGSGWEPRSPGPPPPPCRGPAPHGPGEVRGGRCPPGWRAGVSPAPLLPPQLKDAELGWGRGAHAGLSSASPDGATPGLQRWSFRGLGEGAGGGEAS